MIYQDLVFLCGKNNFKIIGDLFPSNQFKSNLVDLKYIHNIKGDKCEVYEASILKKIYITLLIMK